MDDLRTMRFNAVAEALKMDGLLVVRPMPFGGNQENLLVGEDRLAYIKKHEIPESELV